MMKKTYIPPQTEVVDIKAGEIMEDGPMLNRSKELDQNLAEGKSALWLWDDDDDEGQASYVRSSKSLWDDDEEDDW